MHSTSTPQDTKKSKPRKRRPKKVKGDQPWFLYLLQCDDGSIYTGITTCIKRRVYEHNYTKKGARYTRSRRPVHLLQTWQYPTRVDAGKAENRMKKRTRREKIEFAENPSSWK